MNVGLDYRPALWSRTGISRYVRELAGAFAGALDESDALHLKLFGDCLRRTKPHPRDPEIRSSPWVKMYARRIPARYTRWRAHREPRWLSRRLGSFDLFHATDYVDFPLNDTPKVVTLYDVSYCVDEAFHGPERASRLRAVTGRLIRDARAVLAPSHYTAAEVALRLSFPADRIFVAPLGCDHALRYADEAPRPDVPYVVTIGTLEPRKNHIGALRAFEAICKAGLPHRWRVIGKLGWHYEPFLEALSRSHVRDRVQLEEFVLDEAQVFTSLRGADAMLYPSLLEGFGLPVAEAMALGTPVVTSSTSSTGEIGEGAATLVDPRCHESIASGLRELLEDREYHAHMVERGRTRASELTWRKTAALTLQAYRLALSLPPSSGLSRLF